MTTPSSPQGLAEELAAISRFLIDQRDEPLTVVTMLRLHYWRDKAIEAANRINLLGSAIRAQPKEGE